MRPTKRLSACSQTALLWRFLMTVLVVRSSGCAKRSKKSGAASNPPRGGLRRRQAFPHVAVALKVEPGSLIGTNSLANPRWDELIVGDEHCFFPPIGQSFLLPAVRRLDYRLRISKPQAPVGVGNGNPRPRERPKEVVESLRS